MAPLGFIYHDPRTHVPLGVLRPLLHVRPSLILAHISCPGSLPLPTSHTISMPPCIMPPLPPLPVCPRCRLPSPSPLDVDATEPAKTHPSRFPSSSNTSRTPSSSPLPLSHVISAPQLNSYSTVPLSTRPLLQQKQTRAWAGDRSCSDFASRRARDIVHNPDIPVITWPSFNLTLRLALRSTRGLVTFALPASDAGLLSAAQPGPTRPTRLTDLRSSTSSSRPACRSPSSPSRTSPACR